MSITPKQPDPNISRSESGLQRVVEQGRRGKRSFSLPRIEMLGLQGRRLDRLRATQDKMQDIRPDTDGTCYREEE
jgi:hypothetical protein